MRMLLAVLLVTCACAPAKYFYNFDITDPGAKNQTRPGERDVLDDPDLKAELLADPTNFQAILLIITNTTAEPMTVNWHQVTVIGPDRVARPLRPDSRVGAVEPYTKVRARLIPFELPDVGNAAASYDQQPFELVVPLVVRGQPRDFRIHLLAHAVKL
ncbi:MAG: hypothetical protein Q8L48_32700 [Archangium sp.]|nr:hypothetical protein [Archangium sp.]